MSRPTFDETFFAVVEVLSRRSTCSRRKVGAVLVQDNHIIATGYNGTPRGWEHCDEGGCPRCADETIASGDYVSKICYCVHAEQNAVAMAARFGHVTEGTTMYLPFGPCHECTRLMVQAGVGEVRYREGDKLVRLLLQFWPILVAEEEYGKTG